MAIRNTNFTGATTNWASGELGLKSVDLNDTFNAAFDSIKTAVPFWLNSDLYVVSEDFESYGTGAFTTQGDWTITSSAGSYSSAGAGIVTSTNAGGSGDELHLYLTAGSTSYVEAKFNGLTANRHTHISVFSGIWSNTNQAHSVKVQFGETGTWYNIWNSNSDSGSIVQEFSTPIFIVNVGAGDYDLYLGDILLHQYTSISDTNAQAIRFRLDGTSSNSSSFKTNAKLYMDNIRQSAFDVN